MTRIKERNLNHFLLTAPSGVVLTSYWLEQQGISAKLAWWYVRAGLLERLGNKAYKKTNDKISWAGVVRALQKQLHLPVHVGGKAALQLWGLSHFIPISGITKVILFAPSGQSMPTWLEDINLQNVIFDLFKSKLFKTNDKSFSIIEQSIDGINVRLSCPERAAMEMLYLVPKYETLDEAALIMENLGQLRPAVVELLLEACNSIKVKRLFLYFAEKYEHPWLSRIDLKKINLGHGKRVIGSGGKYNAKYQLSLPEMRDS